MLSCDKALVGKKTGQVQRNKTENWPKVSHHPCVIEGTDKTGKTLLQFYSYGI